MLNNNDNDIILKDQTNLSSKKLSKKSFENRKTAQSGEKIEASRIAVSSIKSKSLKGPAYPQRRRRKLNLRFIIILALWIVALIAAIILVTINYS
jgi:hypothetical protein